jgi:hypothetical protein
MQQDLAQRASESAHPASANVKEAMGEAGRHELGQSVRCLVDPPRPCTRQVGCLTSFTRRPGEPNVASAERSAAGRPGQSVACRHPPQGDEQEEEGRCGQRRIRPTGSLTPSDPRLPSHLAGSDDLGQTGSSAAGTSSSSRRRSNVRSVGGLEGAKLLSAHVRPITCRLDQPLPTRADARAGRQASQLTVRSNTPDQPVQEQAMLTAAGTRGRRRGRVASRDRPPV